MQSQKEKKKTRKLFKYLLLIFKVVLFFPHRLSIGLILNRRTLVAAALYETYNIPIVKRYNQFVFFSEQKLYEFLQSDFELQYKSVDTTHSVDV